jgi:DNA-binding NarL/FixJ family response regulator
MARRPNWVAIPAPSLAEWRQSAPPAVVLICIGDGCGLEVRDQFEVRDRLAVFSRSGDLTPLVILSQPEDFRQFATNLPIRVRAFVPSSGGFEVVIEAIDIVTRGGTYLPASYHYLQHLLFREQPCRPSGNDVAFTGREHAVLGALRQGRSNKRIAYELNMSESTVKVHVRNIMKKLQARNRTEVAFLTQRMFPIGIPCGVSSLSTLERPRVK